VVKFPIRDALAKALREQGFQVKALAIDWSMTISDSEGVSLGQVDVSEEPLNADIWRNFFSRFGRLLVMGDGRYPYVGAICGPVSDRSKVDGKPVLASEDLATTSLTRTLRHHRIHLLFAESKGSEYIWHGLDAFEKSLHEMQWLRRKGWLEPTDPHFPLMKHPLLPKLQNLFGDDKELLSSFMRAHLILEQLMSDTLKECLPNPEAIRPMNPSWARKVQLLDALGALKESTVRLLRAINKVRNELAHNMDRELGVDDQRRLEEALPEHSKSGDEPVALAGKSLNDAFATLFAIAFFEMEGSLSVARAERRMREGLNLVPHPSLYLPEDQRDDPAAT